MRTGQRLQAARRLRRLLTVSGAVLLAICTDEGDQPTAEANRVEAIVQAKSEAGEFHGGLLVARGEHILFRGAVGLADRDRNEPNTPETRYPIHSITKPFTAIVVLQLVNEGLLQLSATIADYISDYEGVGRDRITLHELMSHTSGIPDYLFAIPGYLGQEPPNLPRDSVLSLIGSTPLEFEPGTGFGYSNTGYVLLARVIEEVTGQSYAQALSERIFVPLGMEQSHWQDTEVGDGIARQYRNDGEAPIWLLFPGEGGIVSTLDDMHRFALALGSTELLPDTLWEQAFTPHGLPEDATRFHPAHRSPYGYGFSLPEVPGRADLRVVQHGGQGAGGTTMLVRILDGDGVMLLWNNVSGLDPLPAEILDLLATE